MGEGTGGALILPRGAGEGDHPKGGGGGSQSLRLCTVCLLPLREADEGAKPSPRGARRADEGYRNRRLCDRSERDERLRVWPPPPPPTAVPLPRHAGEDGGEGGAGEGKALAYELPTPATNPVTTPQSTRLPIVADAPAASGALAILPTPYWASMPMPVTKS
jgi:hypothetical protein